MAVVFEKNGCCREPAGSGGGQPVIFTKRGMDMSEPCGRCIHESEIRELQKDAERNSTQHKEFYDKFMKHEKTLAVSDERYTNILTVMSEVKATVNEIKEKPAKRWDSVSLYVMTAIIGAIIGFLSNQLL